MRLLTISAFVVLALAALGGCSDKSEHFTTALTITRTQVIKYDGNAKTIDVELEYSDCPGEQREIFQEDAAFADCISKYKVGDKLQSDISWGRLPDGHYDSEVEKIGECVRHRDAADERSYEVVHECKDITVNGVKVGFQCSRKPTPELLAKCPWFRRK